MPSGVLSNTGKGRSSSKNKLDLCGISELHIAARVASAVADSANARLFEGGIIARRRVRQADGDPLFNKKLNGITFPCMPIFKHVKEFAHRVRASLK
jgi:hypothetical protein